MQLHHPPKNYKPAGAVGTHGEGMGDCRGDGELEGLGAAPAQTEMLGAARAQVGTVITPRHHVCPLWPVIERPDNLLPLATAWFRCEPCSEGQARSQ